VALAESSHGVVQLTATVELGVPASAKGNDVISSPLC
jgi:hypothetical protein